MGESESEGRRERAGAGLARAEELIGALDLVNAVRGVEVDDHDRDSSWNRAVVAHAAHEVQGAASVAHTRPAERRADLELRTPEAADEGASLRSVRFDARQVVRDAPRDACPERGPPDERRSERERRRDAERKQRLQHLARHDPDTADEQEIEAQEQAEWYPP